MSAEADYARILATVEAGRRFTIDDIRATVDAAQLTRFERGELFRYGLREGYLTTRHLTRTTTLPSRKHARVQVYTRTKKRVRDLVAVT